MACISSMLKARCQGGDCKGEIDFKACAMTEMQIGKKDRQVCELPPSHMIKG